MRNSHQKNNNDAEVVDDDNTTNKNTTNTTNNNIKNEKSMGSILSRGGGVKHRKTTSSTAAIATANAADKDSDINYINRDHNDMHNNTHKNINNSNGGCGGTQRCTGGERRERAKSVNTVASRMKQVVEKMISTQRLRETHPQITIFLYKSEQSEITNAFFVELQNENPSLFHNRYDFFVLLLAKYDEFIAALGVGGGIDKKRKNIGEEEQVEEEEQEEDMGQKGDVSSLFTCQQSQPISSFYGNSSNDNTYNNNIDDNCDKMQVSDAT